MPKLTVPKNATVLWRWMLEHDVTVATLASKLGVTPNYLGDIRRGIYRPSDELKVKIERVTKRIEIERGVDDPRGVAASDWFLLGKSPPRSRATSKRRPAATS